MMIPGRRVLLITAWWWVVVVAAALPVSFAASNATSSSSLSLYGLTNESEDDNSSSTILPTRVRIPSFQLALSPTLGTSFTQSQEQEIQDAANAVLSVMLPSKVNYTLEYAKVVVAVKDDGVLNRSQRRGRGRLAARKLQSKTTVVDIDGGIASFRGGEPSVEEVNAWVKEALEGPLVEYLQEESDLAYIEQSVFTSSTSAPTGAPTVGAEVVVGVTKGEERSAGSSSLSFAAIVAGGVVGGFAVLVLLCTALIAMSKRRRSQGATGSKADATTIATDKDMVAPLPEEACKVEDPVDVGKDEDDDERGEGEEDEEDEEDEEEISNTDEEDVESLQTMEKMRSSESGESIVTSSDWTLSSNATDAFTIQNGKAFPRSCHSLMQTESFERDLQVSLKKDMMQTPWSTAHPLNGNVSVNANTITNSSTCSNSSNSNTNMKGNTKVLKGSSFSPRPRSSRSGSYDLDDDWNPDDDDAAAQVQGGGGQPAFRFQAQGEEVVLMPPSRTRTTRSGGK